MSQMERVVFLLLASTLVAMVTAQPPDHYPNLGLCAHVFCVNIAQENCPGAFTPARPQDDICCNRCVVTKKKNESCVMNTSYPIIIQCEKPYTCNNGVCS